MEALKWERGALCINVSTIIVIIPLAHVLLSRFMTMDTEERAGLEIWLLVASHVSKALSSDLESSETTMPDVTVLPEETSNEEGRSRPLLNHEIDGRGRPVKCNFR